MTAKLTQESESYPVIMIVSDQPDVIGQWETAFLQKDYTVIGESPQFAVKTQRLVFPSLIVIDAQLPHKEQLLLCSQLRMNTQSPILLLVSSFHGSQISEIYKAGVNECLLKPVSPAFLMVKAISLLLQYRWLGYEVDHSHAFVSP